MPDQAVTANLEHTSSCLAYIAQMESSVPGVYDSSDHIEGSWRHMDRWKF